jgi:thioredoxin 1
MVHELTSSDDFQTLRTQGKVFVDFYASWCGPCKMQKPVLESFANDHPTYSIIKINVDEFSDLAEQYGVLSIPTLFVFENGREIYKKPGFHALSQLEKL